jgi:hypothetical protein
LIAGAAAGGLASAVRGPSGLVIVIRVPNPQLFRILDS